MTEIIQITELSKVRNDGDSNLWMVAISSETYDPAESVARKVV